MKKTLSVAAAAALVSVLALAAAATADRRTFSDPRGDGGSPAMDVVKLSHDHRNGYLVHTLHTVGSHDDGAPEVHIRVGDGRKPDFIVYGAVLRYGSLRKVGNAKVESVDHNTIRFLFRPAAINNPRSYQWRAVGAGDAPRDRAPNRYATHHLR